MGVLNEETYKNYPFDWLYERTGDSDDRASDVFFMLVEMARQAIEDRELLDKAIERVGIHMKVGRPFPPLIGQVALEMLRDSNNEDIRKRLVDHANEWDVERQINFFQRFSPETHDEKDRVFATQINLLEMQESYGFKPKFRVSRSEAFGGVPEFLEIGSEEWGAY